MYSDSSKIQFAAEQARVLSALNSILARLPGDRRSVMNEVARLVRDFLNVEACGVFLVPFQSSDTLVMEGDCSILTQSRGHETFALRIGSIERGGLTGHLAATVRGVQRLNEKDLRENPYKTGRTPIHLQSGTCRSRMFISLRDRRGDLLGAITVDNRLAAPGLKDVEFTEQDEEFGILLAGQIALIVEAVRKFDFLNDLDQSLTNVDTFPEFLNAALGGLVWLLNAERTEFWKRSATGEMISIGEARRQDHNARRVPESERFHTPADNTLALPVVFQGLELGMLRVESRNLLDSQDRELVKAIANKVAVAFQLERRHEAYRYLIRSVATQGPEQEDLLRGFLGALQQRYDLQAALIFFVDNDARTLRGVQSVGCDDRVCDYNIDTDESFALRVFRDQLAHFSEDPVSDTRVYQPSRQTFGVNCPMIGLPLMLDGEVIGVLLYWQRGLTIDDIHQLEPVSELLAMAILLNESGRFRRRAQEATQHVLTQMQRGPALKDSLQLILGAIRNLGFTRVRILEYLPEEDRLKGLASLGMDDDGEFRAKSVSVSTHPYNRELKRRAVTENDASAHIYGKDAEYFGPDPEAEAFGKSEDCVWAEVPLMIGGRFYGSIAADTEGTNRAIRPHTLEVLTLMGALAAQVIAGDQVRRTREDELHRTYLEKDLHILRNTIFNLDGFAQELQEDRYGESAREEIVALLRSQTQQLVRLAEKTGTAQTLRERFRTFDPICIRRILSEIARAFETANRHYTWEVDLPEEGCFVMCDPGYLQVAFGEVIDNAIRRSKPGHKIGIRLIRRSDSYEIAVLDEAEGPASELDEGDPSLQGRGLGLRIAEEIIEAHNGTTNYDLREGGAGSCFTFKLPIAR
jgi:GAF domain-containing protein